MKKTENKKNNCVHLLKILYFSIFLILILSLVQIFMTNQWISPDKGILTLENKMSEIEEENIKLETEIAKNSSIKIIEEKAKKLGFSEISSVVYLNNPLPVALNTR